MHSEWIKYIFNNQFQHRSLQGHRGSYKTTAITIIGSIYWMLFHPEDRIGIIRKNFTDASKCLKNISEIMKREEIQRIFEFAHGGVVPKARKDRAELLEFNFKNAITPEGNINAYGLKSLPTGTHLDVVLLDDFVTIDDKISRAEREKSKIMLEEIVNNILDPNKLAGFVGTPWHREDAWTLCPDPKKYDVYSTGILSKEQIAEKRRTTTNVTFAANYELEHVAHEDAMFQNPSVNHRWDNRYRKGIGHIDKAYFGADTIALTFAEKKKDGRYQVLGKVFRGNIKDHVEEIRKLHKKYQIGTVYSEDNDDKGFASDLLRKAGIPMSTYHENMNKHVKIQTHLLENGFWHLIDFDVETDKEYLTQVCDYIEGSEPDDAPDSLSCIGRIFIKGKSYYIDRWDKL